MEQQCGQKSTLQATRSADHPLGVIHLALEHLANSYIPKDVTAEIDPENQVLQVRFKSVKEYFAEVPEVLSHFTCTMSKKELIKDMVKKTQNLMYTTMMSDELRKANPNFKLLCNKLDSVQRLACLSLRLENEKGEGSVAGKSREKYD